MKDDVVYLHHILECVRRVQEDAVSGREQLLASRTLQDAVLSNRQTMAESTQYVSDMLKAAYSEIEWRRIGAFRDDCITPISPPSGASAAE